MKIMNINQLYFYLAFQYGKYSEDIICISDIAGNNQRANIF